jgi:hypothetical protein
LETQTIEPFDTLSVPCFEPSRLILNSTSALPRSRSGTLNVPVTDAAPPSGAASALTGWLGVTSFQKPDESCHEIFDGEYQPDDCDRQKAGDTDKRNKEQRDI